MVGIHHFGTNFDDGFVVGVCMVLDGVLAFYPLRKFLTEVDANDFKYYDCPTLSPSALKALIKLYSPKRIFHRVSSIKFVLI